MVMLPWQWQCFTKKGICLHGVGWVWVVLVLVCGLCWVWVVLVWVVVWVKEKVLGVFE